MRRSPTDAQLRHVRALAARFPSLTDTSRFRKIFYLGLCTDLSLAEVQDLLNPDPLGLRRAFVRGLRREQVLDNLGVFLNSKLDESQHDVFQPLCRKVSDR
jgi:hypothetical protein